MVFKKLVSRKSQNKSKKKYAHYNKNSKKNKRNKNKQYGGAASANVPANPLANDMCYKWHSKLETYYYYTIKLKDAIRESGIKAEEYLELTKLITYVVNSFYKVYSIIFFLEYEPIIILIEIANYIKYHKDYLQHLDTKDCIFTHSDKVIIKVFAKSFYQFIIKNLKVLILSNKNGIKYLNKIYRLAEDDGIYLNSKSKKEYAETYMKTHTIKLNYNQLLSNIKQFAEDIDKVRTDLDFEHITIVFNQNFKATILEFGGGELSFDIPKIPNEDIEFFSS
jgi:hypothetical protein